jgi:transcriptional regulator with XRE-family HTH domain
MKLRTFGDRLRWAIARAGLKQGAYASSLGITARYMSLFVTNKKLPGRELLGLMAKDLGISIDWLLGGKPADDSHQVAEPTAPYNEGVPKELQDLWMRFEKQDRAALLRCARLLDGSFDIHEHLVGQLGLLERVKPPSGGPKTRKKAAMGD